MSEEVQNTENEEVKAEEASSSDVKLNGYYVFKKGMSAVYGEQGQSIPVTVLKFEPTVVSQVKTDETDGYEAVQVACQPKKARRSTKAERGHFAKAGFENGAKVVSEIRQALPETVTVGQKVSINSLAKGDLVKLTAKSKGRGYAGGMKRWDFGGGPATHGSGFHRRPGSVGNRTWPGRIMPGKKMAGHFGDEVITMRNVEVVDVIAEENVVLVKGGVPGGTNTIVKLIKERATL